ARCDLTDEAIASPVCGFNEAWRLWIISESFADLTNGNFEDSFAHERSWPDAIEQILFCDELARTGEEMVENCEGLGSELDGLCPAPQALVGQVQTKAIETYTFVVHHCSHRTFPKVYGRV